MGFSAADCTMLRDARVEIKIIVQNGEFGNALARRHKHYSSIFSEQHELLVTTVYIGHAHDNKCKYV